MKIIATSLTSHRIDVKFAEYIATALNCEVAESAGTSLGANLDCDILIVTNGMYNPNEPLTFHTDIVLSAMAKVPSLYLIDDHTCWVPDLDKYPKCKILSQFTIHPISSAKMSYFQVSELAVFDERFDKLASVLVDKKQCLGYWGQYKQERHDLYKEHLPEGAIVIGRRYPKELSDKWTMLPFTKDLNELNTMIQGFSHTIVFGDRFHDGVNLPYRIYEALMNGVIPIIDEKLLGTQSVDIHGAVDYINNIITYPKYVEWVNQVRSKVVDNLNLHITDIMPTVHNKQIVDDTVSEVLSQRATIYGSYYAGVECRGQIMQALNNKHVSTQSKDLPENVRVVFSDIILKLMRAASDPMHADSWLDLAGYTKLINEMFEENPYVFES